MHVLVKMYVMRWPFCWTTFLFDLAPRCIEKKLGFLWALIVLTKLFRYDRNFMMFLSDDKQADIIDAFNTTSIYFDYILNINNVYFDTMVSQIYPSKLQRNEDNTTDTKAVF